MSFVWFYEFCEFHHENHIFANFHHDIRNQHFKYVSRRSSKNIWGLTYPEVYP